MSMGDKYEVLATLGFSGVCGGAADRPVLITHKIWSGVDRLNKDDRSPHPYSMTWYRKDEGLCTYREFHRDDSLAACFGMGGIVPVSWSSSDELALLGKLSQKIRDHDFNAAVFGGTALQTVRLIADRTQKISKALHTLKKGGGVGDIAKALGVKSPRKDEPFTPRDGGKPIYGLNSKLKSRSSTNTAGLDSIWLEASYGWTPLVKDVHEGAQALAKLIGGSGGKTEFRARHKITSFTPVNNANLTTAGFHEIRGQIIYVFEREEDLPSDLAQLGIVNPATLAWELLPWSFVIDWFLPIGSFLDNITMLPFLKGSWCKTYTTRRRWISQTKSTSPCDTKKPAYYDSIQVTRTVGSAGLSVPAPSLKSPISSDWRRTANAIALLTQFKH